MRETNERCQCPVCRGKGVIERRQRGQVKVVVTMLMRQFNVSRRTAFRWVKKARG